MHLTYFDKNKIYCLQLEVGSIYGYSVQVFKTYLMLLCDNATHLLDTNLGIDIYSPITKNIYNMQRKILLKSFNTKILQELLQNQLAHIQKLKEVQQNGQGGLDLYQVQLALKYLFAHDKSIYIPPIKYLLVNNTRLPLQKWLAQGYQFVAFSFDVDEHQVGIFVRLSDSVCTAQIYDSFNQALSATMLVRLKNLLGEETQITLSKSPYGYQADDWSCGVHVITHLRYAHSGIVLENMNVYALSADYYQAYLIQNNIDDAKREQAARYEKYKQLLLSKIEVLLKSTFYAEKNNPLQRMALSSLADFLQLELWGNLDRNNPERKNESKKSQRQRSFYLMWHAYNQINASQEMIEKFLYQLASAYQEVKEKTELVKYLAVKNKIEKSILQLAFIYEEIKDEKYFSNKLDQLLQFLSSFTTCQQLQAKENQDLIDLFCQEVKFILVEKTDKHHRYVFLRELIEILLAADNMNRLETFLQKTNQMEYFDHVLQINANVSVVIFGVLSTLMNDLIIIR